jgi:hypothetical protein
LRAVIELFSAELATVEFPGVSAAGFAEAADQVRQARDALEVARAAMQGARAALDARLQELEHLAERGLAYARIYAEGDSELMRRVDAISLAPPRQPAARRKRRANKPGSGPQLPLDEPNAAPAADPAQDTHRLTSVA